MEKRIAAAYQICRTTSEIESSFNELQAQLDDSIQARLEQTRRTLLEHFDHEVYERLKIQREKAATSLDERHQWLYNLTRFELGSHAVFEDGKHCFRFENHHPEWQQFNGSYDLDWRRAEESRVHFYNTDHPLARKLIDLSQQRRTTPNSCVKFFYRPSEGRISALEPLIRKSGWMRLVKLTVTSLESQDFVFLIGISETGDPLDEDICRKILSLPARVIPDQLAPDPVLNDYAAQAAQRVIKDVDRKNGELFQAEIDKLERWSDDLKLSLEKEVKAIEKELRNVKREGRFATDLASRLAAERRKRDLESRKSQKLKQLFDARADIDKQHDDLVTRLEAELQGQQTVQDLWTVRWLLD